MQKGLVSVIIPTYNRAHLVGAAINSVLAQGYENIEVLVVDDGSKDSTSDFMVRTFGDNLKVRYLPKLNGGVSSARNLGIHEARGEYIALLDADDTWLPGKLKLQLECLELFPEAGMVWTDMAAVSEDGKVLHERYLRKMYSAYDYFPNTQDIFGKDFKQANIGGHEAFCGDIFSPMVLGNLVHTSTVLLRRERLDKVGFFDETFRTGEDYPFHLKTCKVGPVAFIDAVTIHYAVGLADALTSPDKIIQIALNFLSTFERTLKQEKADIKLPAALIRNRLADAYAWVGQEHLNARLNIKALGFFIKSLKAQPMRIDSLKGLVSSLLPHQVRKALSAVKHDLGLN